MRFRVREEVDQTWTIYDVFTGAAVLVAGNRASGLDILDAHNLADLLNWLDTKRLAGGNSKAPSISFDIDQENTLERYGAGVLFNGADTCVHFCMLDRGRGLIIGCRISSEALLKRCDAVDGDYLMAFEFYRAEIESAASSKYDRLGGASAILIQPEDM